MKKALIMGNGININLFNKKVINLHKYINIELKKELKKIKKNCKNLFFLRDFTRYINNFRIIAYQKKWIFDEIYVRPFNFMNFDNTFHINFQYRLQDILKSILNKWLIEEFDINNKSAVPNNVMKMIYSFKNCYTTNYVYPNQTKKNNLVFLHGNFLEEDGIRKRNKEKIKKSITNVDAYNWAMYFQNLPYVHLSNKYGLAEKNSDNFRDMVDSKFEKSLEKEYRCLLSMNPNSIEEPKKLQLNDYVSYENEIKEYNTIVVFGISPYFEEQLLNIASKKVDNVLFIWRTKEEKDSVKSLHISNINFMNRDMFLKKYKNIEYDKL